MAITTAQPAPRVPMIAPRITAHEATIGETMSIDMQCLLKGDATAPRGDDKSRARYIGGASQTDGAENGGQHHRVPLARVLDVFAAE